MMDFDDPWGLNSVLGFNLMPPPFNWMYGPTLEQLKAHEEAHKRWLEEWPILQLERSIQRRFDRCCHGRRG